MYLSERREQGCYGAAREHQLPGARGRGLHGLLMMISAVREEHLTPSKYGEHLKTTPHQGKKKKKNLVN